MTEQTNADLIAEAKSRAQLCDADTREAMRDTGNIIVRLAAALEAAEKRAENAEQGLYDVYDALGFDKDGARTPRELFGPMTNGTPAEIVVEATKEFREDSERGADEAEQRAAEYAAVAEKVRSWAGSHSGSTVSIIRSLIATAPADALREHACTEDDGQGEHCKACGIEREAGLK